MPTIADLVPLVLLPAAIVLAIRGLVALARVPDAGRDAAVSIAVAAAFVVVMFLRDVRPHFPVAANESPWEWVVWFAPAAAVVGIVAVSLDLPMVVRVAVRVAVGVVIAWLLVSRIPGERTDLDGVERKYLAGAAALAIVGLWMAFSPKDAARRPAVAASTVVGVGAGGAVLGLVATTIGMPEALACLAAALGAAALPLPLRSAIRLPAATAPIAAVVLVSILLYAQAFLVYAEIPLATLVLLGVAPAAGWVVPTRVKPLLAVAIAVAATLAVVGAAAAIGGAFAPKPASGY